jgi:septum formation protein
MPRLILGSASPRRAQLLSQLGVEFVVRASEIAESILPGEDSEAYARRMACEKGMAVGRRHSGDWILSADTVVVIDEQILGKPGDAAEARRMLGELSGRQHRVVTAVALLEPGARIFEQLAVVSRVDFRRLQVAEIEAYIESGEPFDKAGAYGIQGAAGSFVSRVEGSYDNVIGLPTEAVEPMLRRAGIMTP